MQYCKRCRVMIENPSERCPLCQGELDGEPEKDGQLFPDLTRERSMKDLGFRIFTFFCAALIIVGLAVNFIIPSRVFWAGFEAAAVVCMWILTAVAFVKRRNLLKNTLWQMVLLCGISLFWDFLTGYRGWSLEYAIPIVILVVFPVLTVIIKLMKLQVSYYMIYYIMACIAGILQMIFLVAGLVKMRIPSVLCGAVSALVLTGLLIFQWKNFWEEVKKKMHM